MDSVEKALSWFSETDPFPLGKSSCFQDRPASSAAPVKNSRFAANSSASFNSPQGGKIGYRSRSSPSYRASKSHATTNNGKDCNSPQVSRASRLAAAKNPQFRTKSQIGRNIDPPVLEIADMSSTTFLASGAPSSTSPSHERLTSPMVVSTDVVEPFVPSSRQQNVATRRPRSQPRDHPSVLSGSNTLFPKAQAMMPVVHIRIRPLLSSMGESSRHRRVWFLDHENMVVRATASLSSPLPQSKQEGCLLPPPSLSSLNALASCNASSDPPIWSFFNPFVPYSHLQAHNSPSSEAHFRGQPLNGIMNFRAGSESMGRLSPTLELSTPTQQTLDPFNRSITPFSNTSLVPPSIRMEQANTRSVHSRSRSRNLATGRQPISGRLQASSMEMHSDPLLDPNQGRGGTHAKHRKRGGFPRNGAASVAVSKKRDNLPTGNLPSLGENAKNNADKHFRFEFIYDEDSTQEEVFEESILRIADEALLGRNVSILCYGPTGSGKTYTMMGNHNSKFFGTITPSSKSQRQRQEDILLSFSPYRSRHVDDNSHWSHCTRDSRRDRSKGWNAGFWNKKERISNSRISSSDQKSAPTGLSTLATVTLRSDNTPLDASQGSLGRLSEEEYGELNSFDNTHRRWPQEFLMKVRNDGHPKPDSCISEDMGILPRLVCVLLDRRGKAVKYSKEYNGAAASPDNIRHTMNQSVHAGALSKSNPPERRTGTVSLTLQDLTFYGIELYVDGLYDLMDPGKRPITNVSDTGGLVSLCKQLDQAREEAAAAASRQNGGSGGKKTGGGIPITSLMDLSHAYRLARRNRIISVHARNDTSSRSHAVFIIQVGFSLCEDAIVAKEVGGSDNGVSTTSGITDTGGKSAAQRRTITSYVAMVDLAGCERLKVTQVKGPALREAQYINKSLSALSSVVLALYHHSKHVPYRDSKLTRILRPCLEGGRVLVLVHVSPCSGLETFNSLRFADQVRHANFQVHHLNDAIKKRGLMDIFEDIVDPEQGRLERAFQQMQKYYDCLCAEVRLAYMTCIDRVVSIANCTATAFSPLRGISAPAENPSSVHSLSSDYGASAGHRSESAVCLVLPLAPSQADLRFFRVYSAAHNCVASLRESENSCLEQIIAMVMQERDRRIELSRKRTEQEIASLRVSIDELTRANASLAQENMSPLPMDSYCEGLLKEIKALTEDSSETEKMIAGLFSCAAVLRQRLAAIDEIDHGIDVELAEMGCGKLSADSVAIGPLGHNHGFSINGNSSLTPITCQDPELREIARQQVILSRDLSLLRLEIASFKIGNHIWQGLWARAMRQELLVAVNFELALMEHVLLDGVMMDDVLSMNVLSRSDTPRRKKIRFSEKDLGDKAKHTIAQLRKRLNEYLHKHPQQRQRIMGASTIDDDYDEITTEADLLVLQGDAAVGASLEDHPPKTGVLELEVSDILNPLAHLNFPRESSCPSASASPISIIPPQEFENSDQPIPPRLSGTFGCHSRADSPADEFTLTLFNNYGDEKALQRVSVRKLLEEGIVCEAYCVNEPFNVVYERFLSPTSTAGLADSVSSTTTPAVGTSTQTCLQGDRIDVSDSSTDPLKGEGTKPSSSFRRLESDKRNTNTMSAATLSLGKTSSESATMKDSKQDQSTSDSVSMRARWGLLKLVRHTRSRKSGSQAKSNRKNRYSKTLGGEANVTYSLDFVYTEDGLPLPPRTVAALASNSARLSNLEKLDDSLSSATDAHREIRRLALSAQARSTAVPVHEHTDASRHAHIASSCTHTLSRESHLFAIPLDAPELFLNAHLLEAGTTRTSPALGYPHEPLNHPDDTLQVALELNRLSFTNGGVDLEGKDQQLQQRETRSSQASSSLGLPHDAELEDGMAQITSSDARPTHDSSIALQMCTVRLSNDNELLLPSTCVSLSKYTCTLLLRFPSPFYSNNTRLESAEAIIAGLCSLMPHPSMHYVSGKVNRLDCAMHPFSDTPSSARTPPPCDTTISAGGVSSVVRRYVHVPYALLLSGKIQEVDFAYNGNTVNLETERDTIKTTRVQRGCSPEPRLLRSLATHCSGSGSRPRSERKKSKGRTNADVGASPAQGNAPVPVATLQVWFHFPESSVTTESSVVLPENFVSHSIASAFRTLEQLRSVTLGSRSGYALHQLSHGGVGLRNETRLVLLFRKLKNFRRKARDLIKQQLYEAEDIEDSINTSLSMYPSHVREIQHNVREAIGFLAPPPSSVNIDPMSSGVVYLPAPDAKRLPPAVPNFLLNSYVDPSRLASHHEVCVKLGRQLGSSSVPWTIWQWGFRWASLGHLRQDRVFALKEGLDGVMTTPLTETHKSGRKGVPASSPIPCPITGTTISTAVMMSGTNRFAAGFDASGQGPLSDDGTLASDQEGFGFGANEDSMGQTSSSLLQVWLPELCFSPVPQFLLFKEENTSTQLR
ncbi:unnamed protein product [Phytomonas sp. EM1]|nr:unnamed protein product [Phytomonas sp. EM1]|eukprot:CCW62586.1 unnamed protein product [Phytomonas sp. isolate EM1]